VQALILCGGRGVRAWPGTAELPKPMLPVGDRPILRHVMDIYASQGVTDFVLAAGYRHEAIATYADELPTDWNVDVVHTGEDAGTGERVTACLDRMAAEFFLTYGDGLGDINLDALLACHRDHQAGATVTVVPLPSQYGTLEVTAEGRVTDFREKPVLADHLINAGFFVVEKAALPGTGVSLERDILPDLGRRGVLFVYRHSGFWRSMDTYKDFLEAEELATREGTPWLPRPGSPEHASSSPAPPGSSART
jgi:glucose-1-phosphate cytidylyltransferase